MAYVMDYYRILQVHYEAAPEVIEAAYRRLSKLNHPDLNSNPAAMERMKQINLAYDVLGDEKRRREYHGSWKRLVSGEDPLHHRGSHAASSVDACYQVLDGYFLDLMMENWDQAYQRLTRGDQQRISLREFTDWKIEVAKVFQLGSYALKLFRKHRDCSVAENRYLEVREYSVYTCDMQVLTGRINEETIPKYVAWDRDEWRICLGYRDLKPFILKLRHMTHQGQHINPDRALADALLRTDGLTGKLSRTGLMEELEREARRSQRYRNDFSVAIIHILPAENVVGLHHEEYKDLCLGHAAEVMERVFRQTDVIGRWSDTSFAVLLTETSEANAKKALKKLTDCIDRIEEPVYEIFAGCSGYFKDSLEETLRMAESNALLRKGRKDGQEKTTILMAGQAV